jgi:hypothetical protein
MPRIEIPPEVLGTDGFLLGRFISPHARYTVAVDPGHERLLTDNRGNTFLHKESDPIVAQFEQSGLRDHEITLAFERWTFSGLPEGTNPITRIGVYDPEAQAIAGDWTDEQRLAVERKLWIESQSHPGDLAFVLTPRQISPWPSYDTDTVEEILEFQARLQVDPETIRSYESENKNRKQIVETMSRLASEEKPLSEQIVTVEA